MIRRRWLIPLGCLALAEALVLPHAGTGYYALVKALGDGTSRLDAYHWWSPDVSWWHDHYYSPKAPLLAFLVLPLSLVLHWVGLQPGNPLAHVQSLAAGQGVDALAIWPLTVVGATFAGFVLLILVRNRAERAEPGYGTAAAVTTGAATLLLPFSALLFDHVLSALLAFAAFALLWHERDGEPSLVLVARAGALAGLAVVAEYPAGIALLILGGYALARERSAARVANYAAGALAGVLPLLVYNTLAWGSPLHVSYVDAVSNTGNSGHDVLGANGSGFYGISLPRPAAALDLLFQHRGLLALCPVLAMSVVGLVGMARRGWRAEAIVVALVFATYFVYNAGYYLPFGGDSSGPRFLVATLPFLGVTLAAAYRDARYPTVALALVSTVMMLGALSAPPLGGDDTAEWARRAGRNEFTDTLLTRLFGWHGIAAFAPVVLLVGIAVVLGYRSLPRTRGAQVELTVFAVLAWALVAFGAAPLLDSRLGQLAVAAGIAVLAVAAVRFVPTRARTLRGSPGS